MVIAITPDEQHEYVPKADRELPPDQQTTFLYRVLANIQRNYLMHDQFDLVQMEGKFVTKMRTADRKVLTLKAGLAGCRNLRDATGAEVKFETEGAARVVLGKSMDPVSDDFLDKLPSDVFGELEEVILRQSILSEGDEKN